MQNKKFLTQKDEIELFLNTTLDSNIISIDIEFMRRNTFFPEPCVIQVSDGKNHACIDLTLKINYKKLFKNIFNDKNIIIIHSCRQDLEILYMIIGYIPKKIFDTQLAASFLGYKYQIGYANLMSELYNIEIDKTEKMTDWKKRPLTENQISYALNDVIYLRKLYEDLNSELIRTNKINFFNEEFKNLINEIEWKPNTNNAWKRIKSINNLNKNTQDLAKIICVWRENKAIKLNLPRNWILSEKEIIEIAKEYYYESKINIPPNNKVLNKKNGGQEIEQEITKFYKKTDEDIKIIKTVKINNNDRKVVNDLYEYYKLISLKNEISPQVFTPKKLILDYIKNKDQHSRLINGWRRELIDLKKVSTITEQIFNQN